MPDHRNINRRKSSVLNIRILNCQTPPLKPERIPTATINQGLTDTESDTYIRTARRPTRQTMPTVSARPISVQKLEIYSLSHLGREHGMREEVRDVL